MIVLDTNVLSEMVRADADDIVLGWVAAQSAGQLYTTAVARAELLYSVQLLPMGRRQQQLQAAVEDLFDEDFADRALPFDSPAANCYAGIAASRRLSGRPINQFDAQVAAITLANNGQLATRNVADFNDCGITVINPWLTE